MRCRWLPRSVAAVKSSGSISNSHQVNWPSGIAQQSAWTWSDNTSCLAQSMRRRQAPSVINWSMQITTTSQVRVTWAGNTGHCLLAIAASKRCCRYTGGRKSGSLFISPTTRAITIWQRQDQWLFQLPPSSLFHRRTTTSHKGRVRALSPRSRPAPGNAGCWQYRRRRRRYRNITAGPAPGTAPLPPLPASSLLSDFNHLSSQLLLFQEQRCCQAARRRCCTTQAPVSFFFFFLRFTWSSLSICLPLAPAAGLALVSSSRCC